MTDLQCQPNAVCPHCGQVEQDSWEYRLGGGLDGGGEVSCGSCGEPFWCEREATVTYSTSKLKAAQEGKGYDE